MRTGRSLSVFSGGGVYLVRGCTWSGGVPGPGGCTLGGTWLWGVPSPGGVPGLGGDLPRYTPPTPPPRDQTRYPPGTKHTHTHPPPCGQTDACKLITLAQLRMRPVKYYNKLALSLIFQANLSLHSWLAIVKIHKTDTWLSNHIKNVPSLVVDISNRS